MKKPTQFRGPEIANRILTALAATVLVTSPGLTVHSAERQSPAGHTPPSSVQPAETDLNAQLMELRTKIARLEAALDQNHQPTPPAMTPARNGMGMKRMGMGRMDKNMMNKGMMEGGSRMRSDSPSAIMKPEQPGMSMMKQSTMKPGQGTPAAPGMARGMGMMEMDGMGKMKRMGMMGKMKGMGGMSGMPNRSALPGFPGASHLYHIGATGFFLDHTAHLQLTTEQQARLNRLKEKAALAQATAERKIEQAEQELWELTATDQPDARKIESKIREIEKLRGDERFAFIRAVGEAAGVLTHEQHLILTGMLQNASTSHTTKP